MSETFVCPAGELPVGEVMCVESNCTRVAVFNVDDELFAVGEMCTHEETSLADGYIVGYQIECPWHLARFDLRTGRPARPPATKDIPVYPVHIREGMIFVDIPDDTENESRGNSEQESVVARVDG